MLLSCNGSSAHKQLKLHGKSQLSLVRDCCKTLFLAVVSYCAPPADLKSSNGPRVQPLWRASSNQQHGFILHHPLKATITGHIFHLEAEIQKLSMSSL